MAQPRRALPPRSRPERATSYAVAIAACFATTVVGTLLQAYLDAANTVMLFLLTVALVARYVGRAPAVLAAILSVALFDFFFVPPRFSFTVADMQYVVTFAVMLALTLIISHLTGGLRRQAMEASDRERRTRALYGVAKLLAGAASVEQVATMVRQWVQANVGAESVLLRRADPQSPTLTAADGRPTPAWLVERVAATAMSADQTIATDQLGDDRYWLLLPLRNAERFHGVLAVSTGTRRSADPLRSHRSMLEALASVVTATLERLHYVEVAQSAQVRASTERLRSSILSAISHDVRTPLTVLYGLADKLGTMEQSLPQPTREAVLAIRDQSRRLSSMVSNLLEMARLQAGDLQLRKEWQPLEEIVGASIQSLGTALDGHQVKTELPAELPLLQFDAVLIERVLANLLENAAKYSPPGEAIAVAASIAGDVVEVSVCDSGPGFSPERVEHVFDLFVRGAPESSVPGMGIGLAICHAIVEAHGGHIRAFNRAEGGACVAFTLPRGRPPAIDPGVAPVPLDAHAHS